MIALTTQGNEKESPNILLAKATPDRGATQHPVCRTVNFYSVRFFNDLGKMFHSLSKTRRVEIA
jgi:hypothetical protein